MNQPSMNHANVHFLPDDENENNEVQQSVVKNADEVKKNKKKTSEMLPLPPSIELHGLQIGVDEAGRGAFAFDVVTAAVVLPSEIPEAFRDPAHMKLIAMIKDSKKMTPKQREKCADFIEKFALYYGIASASPEEIDEHNILKATMLAMHRAIDIVIDKIRQNEEDDKKYVQLLIDGDRFYPYFDTEKRIIVPFSRILEGDAIHMNIAAASILAKVHRDRRVTEICKEQPDLDEKYGFMSNKAYGTKKHMNGLIQHGISRYHRISYAPVKKYNRTRVLQQTSSVVIN